MQELVRRVGRNLQVKPPLMKEELESGEFLFSIDPAALAPPAPPAKAKASRAKKAA